MTKKIVCVNCGIGYDGDASQASGDGWFLGYYRTVDAVVRLFWECPECEEASLSEDTADTALLEDWIAEKG